MRLRHLVVATLSAIGGAAALTIALVASQPASLVTLLGVVLLLNAVVRLMLARS